MKMYLVLCYDKHLREWFAYSEAKKDRLAAQEELKYAPKTGIDDKPVKYRIISFWMPKEFLREECVK